MKDLKILIIDDSKINHFVLNGYLGSMGYKDIVNCYSASDYSNSKINEFDLVFLDIKMPIMDGYQFLNKIRFGYDTTNIIITTASSYVKKDLGSKTRGILYKPVDLFILDKMIHKKNICLL